MSWEDLSDDELMARLIQRGTPPPIAEQCVADRDQPEMSEVLGVVFDG